MPVFHLADVGATVACPGGKLFLRQPTLQANRFETVSEQTAGCLAQDVVNISGWTSNCLFSILIIVSETTFVRGCGSLYGWAVPNAVSFPHK